MDNLETVVVCDDDGNELTFKYVADYEYKDNSYAVLIDEDHKLHVLKNVDDGFVTMDKDTTLEVYDAFMSMINSAEIVEVIH